MEQVDVDYYNSLKWIQDNDPTCLDLTFTMEKDMFGETVTTELKPGGRNIPVKQNNKKEFIKLVIQERFQKRVRAQMANVMLVRDILHCYIQLFQSSGKATSPWLAKLNSNYPSLK